MRIVALVLAAALGASACGSSDTGGAVKVPKTSSTTTGGTAGAGGP